MTGSKTTSMDRKAVLEALKNPPPSGDFIWDGENEDERPLTKMKMQAGRRRSLSQTARSSSG